MRILAAAAVVLAIAGTAASGIPQVIPDGSAPPAAPRTPSAPAASSQPSVAPEFVIGPGDILQVKVWQEPQFGEIVEVRPDGKISLPLVSDVEVAGLTTDGAENRLTAKLAEFVKHPVVSVVVTQVHSKQIYVIGQVVHPGPYPLLEPINVEQSIAEAGGVTRRAKKKQVYILRDGSSKKFSVNYAKILQGKNLRQNVWIGPGDTVVVP